jgi:hypothetical protein
MQGAPQAVAIRDLQSGISLGVFVAWKKYFLQQQSHAFGRDQGVVFVQDLDQKSRLTQVQVNADVMMSMLALSQDLKDEFRALFKKVVLHRRQFMAVFVAKLFRQVRQLVSHEL